MRGRSRRAGEEPVIVAMRPDDLDAGALGELGRPAGMIDMAMGQEDAVERNPHLAHRTQDVVDIAAGVDDDAMHGLRRPQRAQFC